MGLLRTDASDPHLDLGGSVMMEDQLTDADAWCSRQTSGLMTVDHEQLRDESKQSKALDDDDKLPTTYQVSDPRAGPTVPSYNPILPIVPSYKPTSWGFQNHCNLLQAMGPPDGEYDLGSFSDEESDVDMYCKVYEFSDGSVDDGNEKLPTTYQPDALGNQTSNNLTHAGYDGFRANASSFFNNPRSFTEEETKTYNKIVQETDGFGSIYVPPGVSTPGLLMPAKIEFVGKEGSMMLDGLAELAVVRYNEDNETSYQVVKIIRVNFRFDGWMFYNMTFQARDDKAGSLPRNFQARIRRLGTRQRSTFAGLKKNPNQSKSFDCAYVVPGLNIPGLLSPILLENIHPNTKEILIEMAKLAIQYFNKGNVKSYTFLKLSKVNSRLVPHLVARGLDRVLHDL